MQGTQKQSIGLLKWLFFSIVVLASWAGCDKAVSSQAAEIPTAPISTSAETKPVLTEPQALDEGEYEILGNIEMVEYCLPYPKNEFKEDYDLAEYKGQHVMVSKDKKSKITYSGNMVELSLEELFTKSQQDVEAMNGAKVGMKNIESEGFRLAWEVNGQEHHLKKWYRKEAMETVTVHFEYPISQTARFEPWIETIGKHSTHCEQ